MMKLLWFVLGTVMLLSCAEKQLELTSIEEIPPGVSGCSCIFAKSREDFDAKKYVFISTSDISVLSVQNELIIWSPYGDEDPPFSIITSYSSENQINPRLKEFDGKIIVTSNEGTNVSMTVYGQCGC